MKSKRLHKRPNRRGLPQGNNNWENLMAKGDWGEVSLLEVAGIAMVSMTVGAVKLLQK